MGKVICSHTVRTCSRYFGKFQLIKLPSQQHPSFSYPHPPIIKHSKPNYVKYSTYKPTSLINNTIITLLKNNIQTPKLLPPTMTTNHTSNQTNIQRQTTNKSLNIRCDGKRRHNAVNGKSKSKFILGGFFSKKFLSLSSLFFMMVFISSIFISGVNGTSLIVPDVVVGSEIELLKAVRDTPDNVEYVIGLRADIVLENSFEIPGGKNITLVSVEGFWSLYGANKQYTIGVTGFLTIDNIGVTHANGNTGRGVYVKEGGTLVLLNGEISNNIQNDAPYGSADHPYPETGGGVYIDGGGSFVMLGGVISHNNADYGGGVRNRGIFTMTGGIITNNTAHDGGGVDNSGRFIMSGGKITGNTATNWGGGLYYITGSFKWHSGKISGNTPNDLSRPMIYTTPPYDNYFWSDSGVWIGKIQNNLLLPSTVVVIGIAVAVSLLFYRSKRKTVNNEREPLLMP